MADDEKTEGPTKTEGEEEKATETEAPAGGSPGIIKLIASSLSSWVKTTKAKAAIIGFIMITAGLYGLFTFQASSIEVKTLDDIMAGAVGGGSSGDGKDPFAKFDDMAGTAPLSGSASEGQEDVKPIVIDDMNVYEVQVVVTWVDEADTARHTNQPDSFEVVVTAPDGREARGSGTNQHGDVGMIEIDLTRNITKEALDNKELKKKTKETTWTGDWNLTITLTQAGDQEAILSIIGLRDQADNGNSYEVTFVWTFKGEAE